MTHAVLDATPSTTPVDTPAAMPAATSAGRRRMALIGGGVGLLLLAIAAGLALLPRADAADAASANAAAPAASKAGASRPALTVTRTTAQSQVWPLTLAANGSVAAWQEASVGAEAAGLRLVELKANVGDQVRRGQVLAVLQSSTLQAELAATRASLAEARAVLASAEADAARARALDASGAISAQQIQQQATAAETARARVAALEARLSADELRLAQTRIEAPDAGVIALRTATLGSVVAPGQELFRLIRQNRLEWRAEVPAADLARLRPGTLVTLAGGAAPGSATANAAGGERSTGPITGPIAGRVRLVGPTVDPATRMGLVYVDLARPGTLKAGMFARGEFELGRGPVMTLPQSAVLLRDGFTYVFRLQGEAGAATARASLTKVQAGRRQGERIEIVGGLAAGEAVVASGVGFLADGDTVRVVNAPSAAAPAPAAPVASASAQR